jgi:hypothetical protein
MDGVTLGDAIADVRGYIDDREGRRWDRDQVVRAIHSALSSCMELYGRHGGERFDVEAEVTSTSDGVSLITQDPLAIRHLLLQNSGAGTWTTPIHAADPRHRGAPDTSTRTMLVRYMPRPAMPMQDDDVLMGLIPGNQRPWPAFERWVCMRAAMELGITDKDDRAGLHMAEETRRVEIIDTQRIPGALPWPRGARSWWRDLRWVWFPQTAVLKLYITSTRG